MKKLLVLLALAFVFVSGAAFAAEFVEGEVLVVVEAPKAAMSLAQSDANAFASALSVQAQTFASSVGAQAVATYPEIAKSGKSIVFIRKEGATTEQLIAEVKKAGGIVSVSPNYIRYQSAIPNDTHYDKLWGMGNIGAPTVWDNVTGSSTIVVAVIDGGIDFSHEDLKTNLATDSDGDNGKIFYRNKTHTGGSSPSRHGTHVAGTIGAVGDNGKGVAGVNWNVKLWGADVFGGDGAYDSTIAGAIEYILKEKRSNSLNVRVANMSLGGWNSPEPPTSALGSAVKSLSDEGVIVCMAAGNEGEDIKNHGVFPIYDSDGNFDRNVQIGELSYPACFRFENTLSVGAIEDPDRIAEFSNYSPEWVDIAAPGVEILSTVPGNQYAYMQGTSMATPMTAGAAALLCAAFPDKSASEIKALMMDNAVAKDTTNFWLSGLLDVAAAYNAGGDDPADAIRADEVFDTTPFPGEKYRIAPDGTTLELRGSFIDQTDGKYTLIPQNDFSILFMGNVGNAWQIDENATYFQVSPSGATLRYGARALMVTFSNTIEKPFTAWLPIVREIAGSAIAETETAHVKITFSGKKNSTTPTKSGGGGCSAGFASLALFALVPFVFRKKK